MLVQEASASVAEICVEELGPLTPPWGARTVLLAQREALFLARRCLASLEVRGSRAFPGRQCSGKGLWSESLRFQILGPSRPGSITWARHSGSYIA